MSRLVIESTTTSSLIIDEFSNVPEVKVIHDPSHQPRRMLTKKERKARAKNREIARKSKKRNR